MTKNVYDRVGKLVGRISTDEKGNETVYAADGRLLGRSLVTGSGATKSTIQVDNSGALKGRGGDGNSLLTE
jgi:hypothetical protein